MKWSSLEIGKSLLHYLFLCTQGKKSLLQNSGQGCDGGRRVYPWPEEQGATAWGPLGLWALLWKHSISNQKMDMQFPLISKWPWETSPPKCSSWQQDACIAIRNTQDLLLLERYASPGLLGWRCPGCWLQQCVTGSCPAKLEDRRGLVSLDLNTENVPCSQNFIDFCWIFFPYFWCSLKFVKDFYNV